MNIGQHYDVIRGCVPDDHGEHYPGGRPGSSVVARASQTRDDSSDARLREAGGDATKVP
jgi:hypothetical protein